MKKKAIALVLAMVMLMGLLTGFANAESNPKTADEPDATAEVNDQQDVTEDVWLPPLNVDYTLDCYNLARRFYWINGQYEEAMALECPIEKPQRYIVLMLEGVGVVATFAIDGKATSLNSCLPSESEYYATIMENNEEMSNIQGYYLGDEGGIFFFTPEGDCIEWNGKYLYSNIEFNTGDTLLTYDMPEETDE